MHSEIRKRLDSRPKTEAAFVEPMESLAVSKLPKGSQSIWENWLDGYRALAIKSGKDVTLSSRWRSLYDYFAISWPKCFVSVQNSHALSWALREFAWHIS